MLLPWKLTAVDFCFGAVYLLFWRCLSFGRSGDGDRQIEGEC